MDHSQSGNVTMDLDHIAKSVHRSHVKKNVDYADDYAKDDDYNVDDHDYDVDDDDEYNNGGYEEINKKLQKFSKLLVNSFFPDMVPRFFMVPKLHQLPDKDKHLKPNEVLAGFIDFLRQVLCHEANIREDEEQWYGFVTLLLKQLSFFHVVLGDMPFQSSHQELAGEVENVMVEVESFANEIGILVYDQVFRGLIASSVRYLSVPRVFYATNWFDARANSLSEKVEVLNDMIIEHCIKFEELPLSVISSSGVTDSFDIIPSVVVDIENLLNRRLSITDHDDSTKDQMVTLHGELTLLQSFITVFQVVRDTLSVSDKEKEALVQIIDLAYEVEYLISSHFVGNVNVWYLNLRLSSPIQKIKLAREGLHNLEMQASKALKAFDSEVSFRSTEEENVNNDIAEKSKYRKKLEVGYNHLPYYIKPCILYTATFPENAGISKELLACTWIAEGSIPKEEKKDYNTSETSNLRSLSFVCINKQKEREIFRHLHKLKFIYVDGVLFPDMSSIHRLKSLKIYFPTRLNVPDIKFPSRLRKLCLSGAVLTGEHMSTIEQLDGLEVLKLEKHTFVDVWEVRGFMELRVLEIESNDLREWEVVSSASFLRLECLVVKGCTKLTEFRNNLHRFEQLKRIEVMKCGPGVYLWLGKNKFEYRGVNVVTDKNLESFMLQDIQSNDKRREFRDPGSMKHLSEYLKEYVPRNWDACTFVVHYVLQFHSNMDDHREFLDVVTGLNRIAGSYFERKDRLQNYSCFSYETEKKEREFSELFVNSFIPKVQKFFKVLKSYQLSDKDKHLNQNEILAAFFDFVIQVLHRQENISSGEEQLHALLRKQLSFHLAILGDIPFQTTHLGLAEQVNNLLEEFELLANEAGSFIYSCVFPIRPMDSDMYCAETINLLVKAELLNDTIKHHCHEFSALPMSVVSRSVVDSVFIIHSLIEDIDSTENHKINLIDDDEIKRQIGLLKVELNTSKGVTEVSDQFSGVADANVQKEALIQIRDLAYQAEYLINSHVVGNIPDWFLNLRLPPIVKEIKIVNAGLQHVKKMQQDSNVMTKAPDGKESTKHDNDFPFVSNGVEETVLKDLIRRRMKQSQQTIILHGMPGLGKTTTATKLYNHPEICEYFDRRAWCVVSQSYDLRALFVQILKDIAPGDNNALENETTELGLCIRRILSGKRYLIVLDDVWESEVLYKMIRQLPDDCNGSSIIVTSRDRVVAPGDSILHALFPLSKDQSWDLLRKKVFSKEPCPSQLKDVGKQIAEKCCGLPLAVVTAAGILATLEKERSVWQRVAKLLDVLLMNNKSDYKKILELSYEHLPHNLKPCFLYFAAFPEDAEISKKDLTWYWMAQGFIPKYGRKSPEEIAENYFLNLINRSLVMPAKRGSDGRIRTCRIHDLLRDICVAKAKEENFIKFTKDFSIYENHQGLCLSSRNRSDIVLRPFDRHCRSFRYSLSSTYQSSYFGTMPLLKTVELPQWNSDTDMYPRFDLPDGLRYLVIGDLQIRTVANLVNLEFIRVRGYYDNVIVVPSVVLRMMKLRHLSIRQEAEFEEDCSSNMSETTNLRSLSYVCFTRKKDEDILRLSPHLKKLKCKIGGDEILFPDLSALGELESLRIDCKPYFRGEILLSEASFPSTIKKLCLRHSKFPWEKMSIIGKLPKLQVLKLEYNAFVGEEWETNCDEFQELRFLNLKSWDLKKWSTESSHFPSLEQLVIDSCRNLEEIPTDLGYIQSLQRITVKYCDDRIKASAQKIKDEQREENGNTQLQVYCVDYGTNSRP